MPQIGKSFQTNDYRQLERISITWAQNVLWNDNWQSSTQKVCFCLKKENAAFADRREYNMCFSFFFFFFFFFLNLDMLNNKYQNLKLQILFCRLKIMHPTMCICMLAVLQSSQTCAQPRICCKTVTDLEVLVHCKIMSYFNLEMGCAHCIMIVDITAITFYINKLIQINAKDRSFENHEFNLWFNRCALKRTIHIKITPLVMMIFFLFNRN